MLSACIRHSEIRKDLTHPWNLPILRPSQSVCLLTQRRVGCEWEMRSDRGRRFFRTYMLGAVAVGWRISAAEFKCAAAGMGIANFKSCKQTSSY